VSTKLTVIAIYLFFFEMLKRRCCGYLNIIIINLSRQWNLTPKKFKKGLVKKGKKN